MRAALALAQTLVQHPLQAVAAAAAAIVVAMVRLPMQQHLAHPAKVRVTAMRRAQTPAVVAAAAVAEAAGVGAALPSALVLQLAMAAAY